MTHPGSVTRSVTRMVAPSSPSTISSSRTSPISSMPAGAPAGTLHGSMMVFSVVLTILPSIRWAPGNHLTCAAVSGRGGRVGSAPGFRELLATAKRVATDTELQVLYIQPKEARLVEAQDGPLVVLGHLREPVVLDQVPRHLEIPEGLEVRLRVVEHRPCRPDEAVATPGILIRDEGLSELARFNSQDGTTPLPVFASTCVTLKPQCR